MTIVIRRNEDFQIGIRGSLTPIAGEPAVGLEVGGKASGIVLSGPRARRQAAGGYHEIVFSCRRPLVASVRKMLNPFTGSAFPILRFTGNVGVVPPAGLEPAAPRLGISCSIRLSYGGILDGSLLNTGAAPCQLTAHPPALFPRVGNLAIRKGSAQHTTLTQRVNPANDGQPRGRTQRYWVARRFL